jgi:hypothetical protein
VRLIVSAAIRAWNLAQVQAIGTSGTTTLRVAHQSAGIEGYAMAPAQFSLAEFIMRKWPALIIIVFTVSVMLVDNVVDII